MIDRNGQGSLTAHDFRDVLADSGFYATDRELGGLMYRMDQDKDNKVSLQEFTDQLMPRLRM